MGIHELAAYVRNKPYLLKKEFVSGDIVTNGNALVEKSWSCDGSLQQFDEMLTMALITCFVYSSSKRPFQEFERKPMKSI